MRKVTGCKSKNTSRKCEIFFCEYIYIYIMYFDGETHHASALEMCSVIVIP